MAAESLREELMELVGVAEAEVDEAADSPSGVRVRLEPDADARLVGAEVQRVLAAHGLRSRITAQEDQAAEPDDGAAPPAPSEDPSEVVPETTSEMDLGAAPDVDSEPDLGAESIAEPAYAPPVIPPPPLTPPPVVAMDDPEPEAPVSETVPTAVEGGRDGLVSVAVEESAVGVTVTATAHDGRTVTQTSDSTEDGMFAAAVAAVGTLAQGSPPGVVSITSIPVNGTQAITVVLERADGSKVAGAAVVAVSAGYAVGRATWSALKGD